MSVILSRLSLEVLITNSTINQTLIDLSSQLIKLSEQQFMQILFPLDSESAISLIKF
jgi:hypothetical protein